MKILLSLEHTIVSDIANILRRLPFQPHFLKDFEAQLEAMVVEPVVAPVIAPVVDLATPAS